MSTPARIYCSCIKRTVSGWVCCAIPAHAVAPIGNPSDCNSVPTAPSRIMTSLLDSRSYKLSYFIIILRLFGKQATNPTYYHVRTFSYIMHASFTYIYSIVQLPAFKHKNSLVPSWQWSNYRVVLPAITGSIRSNTSRWMWQEIAWPAENSTVGGLSVTQILPTLRWHLLWKGHPTISSITEGNFPSRIILSFFTLMSAIGTADKSASV